MMFQLKDLRYLVSYLVPFATFLAIYFGGWLSFLTLMVGFGAIPLLELFFKGSIQNLTSTEEAEKKVHPIFDWMLYLNVPIQLLLLVFYLETLQNRPLAAYEWWGMTLSFGMCCGILGINVAHELGHRAKSYEQWMSKILLMTSLYMHFFIEHNRGHHKNVSTPLDPASARLNEPLYLFYVRSIIGSYLSAWKLENRRVQNKGWKVWSLRNEMVQFHIIQAVFLGFIFALYGTQITIAFLGSALMGYLLLETVNYIEHYGLRRKEVSPGVYERVMPWHSWNSNHDLGRIFLYELTRHSDHHYLASRKYQILRHFDHSPQLPTGYPGSMLIALFPPLWFRLMNPRIQKFQQQVPAPSLAA